MSNQKKQDEKKGGVGSVVAAVTVAVVGVGIAVAGAVALKDKKNRNKVKEALTNAKDKVVDYLDGMQNQAKDKIDEAEKKLAEGKKMWKEKFNG